ncbi:MAG: twin-arginine translocase TatA/TatE family subunit [Bacteroidales bacterium]|nr:twin-arginine translocase TatA/TatE family subunit [Bacteroidales bacterium]
MLQTCGIIGTPELLLILAAIILLFGGKKIPELAKGLGKGMKEFKEATTNSDLSDDMKDVVQEINDLKKDIDKLKPKR